MESQVFSVITWLLPLIIIVGIWDAVWKAFALWKAARNNHIAWFICIIVFNTMGILPIIYILIQKNKKETNPA